MTTITDDFRKMTLLDLALTIKDEADRKGVSCSMRRAQKAAEKILGLHQRTKQARLHRDPTASRALKAVG